MLLTYHFIQLYFTLNQECKLCRIQYLLNGTAAKPFQYRILIPWITKLILKLNLPFYVLRSSLNIVKLINFISLFLFVIIYRYFLFLIFKNEVLSIFLSFTVFYILPFNYLLARKLPLWYPWDMSALLFFMLGVLFIYKKKWVFYYLIFILGTLNKETTCFLTLIYLYTAVGKSKLKIIIFHCIANFSIWASIKYFLYLGYYNSVRNGFFINTFFENKIRANLEFLINIDNILLLLSNFGFLWIPTFILIHKIDNDFIKNSFYVLIFYFIGMFYVGNIYELRIFGEFIPIISTAFYIVAKNAIQDK